MRPNVAVSAVIAIMFLTIVPGSVVDTSSIQDTEEIAASPLEVMEMLRYEQSRIESDINLQTHNSPSSFPTLPLAPYPEIAPDGRPMGSDPPVPGSTPYWQNMSNPPNNTGGGYSYDTRSSIGEYQVGSTHEMYIGDQNGNGLLEWVSYYFHRPSSVNGLDDDGDGCVDEPTFGDASGQTGCDTVPDAMVYFETGANAFLGGSNGDLVVMVDYFTGGHTLEIFKIGVSPRWMGYSLRGVYLYPRIVGDFISYYAFENYTNTNANPEMDNDQDDHYVGSIDVRLFPLRSPRNHVCAAGDQMIDAGGVAHMRYDGWIVGAFNLVETYDQHDWNGDGDIADKVMAYYAVDPNTGSCRQGVNVGVAGVMPISRGTIMTTMYTYEHEDNRDWTGDTDLGDIVSLYHDINSTWPMKGRMYVSTTFTSPVPQWGFGWTAIYDNVSVGWRMPLEFGGVLYRYIGLPYNYKAYFWLTSDEDGDRHTMLPEHEIGYGQPGGTFGGRCALIYAREEYLGVDVTGDGDIWDTVNGIFCPNETGGGGVWVSKGPIIGGEQTPWEFQGYVYFRLTDYRFEDSQGRVAMPFSVCEGVGKGCAPVELDGGDHWYSTVWIHLSYLFEIP